MKSVFYPKILTSLKGYTGRDLARDLVAGIIVGIIALPLALAFGIASGVTPEAGIITAIVAGLIVSALGGSRVQIGGPTGAFVVIVYGIIQDHGMDGLLLATAMAGLFLVMAGAFRLGNLIKYIPSPVIVGFTSAIAVVIFSIQIKDIFGLDISEVPSDFVLQWQAYLQSFGSINWSATGLALMVIGIVIAFNRFAPRVPGAFAALALATLLASFFDLPVETIGSRFGAISSNWPAPNLPQASFQTLQDLIAPALAIALLGGIESLLSAAVSDTMIKSRHRSNTELIAQGIANIVSPLFGGIPATGAIARTATNVKNGGRTPVAGIVHAITLFLIFLFAISLAAMIPMAALGGILVVVAYNMSEWRRFKQLLKTTKSNALLLLTTFLLTVFVDLTVGIGAGVALAGILSSNGPRRIFDK